MRTCSILDSKSASRPWASRQVPSSMDPMRSNRYARNRRNQTDTEECQTDGTGEGRAGEEPKPSIAGDRPVLSRVGRRIMTNFYPKYTAFPNRPVSRTQAR